MTQMLPFKSLQSNWDKSNILEIILDAVRFYVLCGIDHSRSSSEPSVKLQVFEERRVSGAGVFTDLMNKCPETVPVGLRNQDPHAGDLVASLAESSEEVWSAMLPGQTGVGSWMQEWNTVQGRAVCPWCPSREGMGRGLRLCGGPRHVEPLADALDGTGLWSHSQCE